MNSLSRNLFAALMGVALLSSCSRPVAYFQPSQRENFRTPPTANVAVATPAEATQPTAQTDAPTPATDAVLPAVPTPAVQVAQAKVAMEQLDAYVKNDSKLTGNRKLAKRMARANALLAEADANPAAIASPHKATFTERLMLKKISKKIKNKIAPDQTNALTDNKIRNGAIIGAIGLVLAIIFNSNLLSLIGVIILAAGIVLIVMGVLET